MKFSLKILLIVFAVLTILPLAMWYFDTLCKWLKLY